MREGWGDRTLDMPQHPVADLAAPRAAQARRGLPRRPAGAAGGHYKVRANDTDYRFRAHRPHLLLRQPSLRRRRHRGRRVGALRPSPLPSATPDEFTTACTACGPGRHPLHAGDLRLLRESTTSRSSINSTTDRKTHEPPPNKDLARVHQQELRLIKDNWESASSRKLPTSPPSASRTRSVRACASWQAIEAPSFRRARAMGNRHGLRLHLRRRLARHDTALDRQHRRHQAGQAGPADMGVEGHDLYTANGHRTLPVDGRFRAAPSASSTTWCTAHSQHPTPGAPFLTAHNAMTILAHSLEDMQLLPVSAEEALDRTWESSTPAGPSTAPHHMLRHGRSTTAVAPCSDIYPKGNFSAEGMVLHRRAGLRRTRCWSRGAAWRTAVRSRGRRVGHPRTTTTEPLGLTPPRLGRHWSGWAPCVVSPGAGASVVDGVPGLPPLRISAAAPAPCSGHRAGASSPTRRRTRVRWSTRRREPTRGSATRPRWRSAAASTRQTLGILDRGGQPAPSSALPTGCGRPSTARPVWIRDTSLVPNIATRRGELKHMPAHRVARRRDVAASACRRPSRHRPLRLPRFAKRCRRLRVVTINVQPKEHERQARDRADRDRNMSDAASRGDAATGPTVLLPDQHGGGKSLPIYDQARLVWVRDLPRRPHRVGPAPAAWAVPRSTSVAPGSCWASRCPRTRSRPPPPRRPRTPR